MKRVLVVAFLLSLLGFVPANAEDSYVGPPSPITELRELNVSDWTTAGRHPMRLQWDLPQENGSKVTKYEVFAREMPMSSVDGSRVSTFPWRLIYTSNSATRDITFSLPFWARNKTIEFTLVAHNAYGPSHEPTAKFTDVAMAKMASCALTDTGNVYCWGTSEGHGELGDYNTGFVYPRKITGLGKVTDVSAGDVHFCAISDGDVYCWGRNASGELTGVPGADSAKPMKVQLPERAIDVQAAESHSCAQLASGDLYCWGSDEYSQLAGAGPAPSLIFSGPLQKVSAEGIMTCVLDLNGDVYCTGVANNEFFDFTSPIAFTGKVSDVAAGQHALCAVVTAGVECLGYGRNGEIGTDYGNSSSPRLVPGSQGLEKVFNKRYSVCGIGELLEVKCWGNGWVRTKLYSSPSATSQTTYGPALVKAVELQNRSAGELFDESMGTASGPFFNNGTYDWITNLYPAHPMLQDPVVIAPGEHGSCGIDRFGQLWCSAPIWQPETPIDYSIWTESSTEDSNGNYLGKIHAEFEVVDFLTQHFLTLPRFVTGSTLYSSMTDFPERKTLTTSLRGKNEVGQTLTANLAGIDSASSKVEYIWYRGTGEFKEGNFAYFEIIPLAHSRSYTVTAADQGKSIGVAALVISDKYSYETKPEAFLLPGQGSVVAVPFGWTKRLGDTQAKLYAKDIIGAGKVVFKLNGKEIAWVNAKDESDPKLRLAGGSNYLVRTVNLAAGKNVLEVYINGERVKRTVYSR